MVVGTVGNVKRGFGDKCNATWWLNNFALNSLVLGKVNCNNCFVWR